MPTTDNSTSDEQSRQDILENIDKFGCHLVLIEADNYMPAFVYSIGLFQKFKHPEIICFGLNINVMAGIINHACDLIKKGDRLAINKPYSGFLEGYDIQFIPVEKTFYQNYLGYAGWFYDMSFDFPAIQLVWPDKLSKFPWQQGFNSDWEFKQPLLDRNSNFKFYEKKDLGVYTTKQALAGEPILFVYHNNDGDWQFHTNPAPNLEDAQLVCLEEIVKLDPTINEIYHLQFGWKAWRNSIESGWEYAEDLND